MPRTVFLWLLTSAIFKHFALRCILSNFSLSCLCHLSHILYFALSLSFAFPLCAPPERSGLQLKLIQAWKGSDDFSWKNCILFAYCFEPCYYPVACFTVIPLNRKTGMEKPLHSLWLVQRHLISKISPYSDWVAPRKGEKNGFSLVLSVYLAYKKDPCLLRTAARTTALTC